MQLRDFGRMASGNSRILVLLRSRVVKLTKALKPEKSAEKGASVGAGVRYSNICIDRLGGQGFKLAISRPRDACTNLLSYCTDSSRV